MQIFIATMLDEEEVADHNAPTIIAAGSEALLLNKVREFVKASYWLDAMDVNRAEVDTMSIDDMNEKLCSDDDDTDDSNDGRCILVLEHDI